MSDRLKCAACGLPAHRYGRNEGMDRYDPMACINQLRGLLANGERVDLDALVGEVGLRLLRYERSDGTLTIERVTTTMLNVFDAAIGDRLLIEESAYALANGERVEPDYGRADEAFNEALRLAGAHAHGPTMVITRFIVDAAIGDRLLIDPPKPS